MCVCVCVYAYICMFIYIYICVCVCVCVCIYIYIIIMIINKYILYIFNPWKILFCNLRFLEVYNNIHQAVKKME